MTKSLTHKLLSDFVLAFAPMIDKRGICNGFTSMLLQAACTSKEDLALFYQRLDDIALELKKNTPSGIKADIDNLYQSQKNSINKIALTEEGLKKTELRAFAEGIAIQQDPGHVFNSSQFYQDNKNMLYSLTASKKIEANQLKLNINTVGNIIPDLLELECYLEQMQSELKAHAQDPFIGFMLNSPDHSTGVFLDPDSGKFHFIDINTFGQNPTYHVDVDAKELAPLLFNLLCAKNEVYCPIRVVAFSTAEHIPLVSTLKNMALKSLFTENHFLRQTTKQQHILSVACTEGDVEIVSLLLNDPNIDSMLNAPNNNGETPLFLACEYGHTEIVKLLLAKKNKEMIKSIEKINSENHSPLSIAKEYDHTEIVTLLKAAIPPWKPLTFKFTVTPPDNSGQVNFVPSNPEQVNQAKRKAEDQDLNDRPTKKPNNDANKMEEEPSSFPCAVM